MRRAAAILTLVGCGLAGHAQAAPILNVSAVYEARLLIKVADLRADQSVRPDGFKAGARVATIGALGVIKPAVLEAHADGGVAGGAPSPAIYVQIQKNKQRIARYTAGGQGSLADPLTQLLRAALQPGSGSPCIGTTPVYDGRQRYDLILSPAGARTLSGATAHFGLVHPVACRLGFRPISGFSSGAQKKNPFVTRDPEATFAYEPRAQVWLMTDVSVPTLVGTGHIALTSVHMDGARPTFTAPAPPPPVQTRPNKAKPKPRRG